MNSRKRFLLWVLGGVMLGGITSCSDNADTPVNPDEDVRVRRMTISQTEDTAETRQVQTRATPTEDGGLTASWTAGDGLTYCNLMRTQYNGNTYEPVFGNLTAVSTVAASQFTGDVACKGGDYIAVVYPATTFSTNESYTISLTGQDGTLSTLATTFHYVFGKATVTSVTDATANATMPKMKSLLTVCKFSFIDQDTSSPIPIQSLTISYGGSGSNAGTYPQSATVAIGVNTAQDDVHAAGIAGAGPLSVTCPTAQSSVYVALLPTANQRTFRFTVTNTSGTYSGTAKATLVEGEYVVATGLKLTKQ